MLGAKAVSMKSSGWGGRIAPAVPLSDPAGSTMAGTYTQRRHTPSWSYPRYALGQSQTFGPPKDTDFSWGNAYTLAQAPMQVTTSYRTGGGLRPITPTPGELFKSAREGDYGSIDNGHPFSTDKQELIFSHEDVFLTGQNLTSGRPIHYRGLLKPNEAVASGVESWGTYYAPPSGVSYQVLGAEAINNTIPTNPTASLAVTLAELKREGLPALVGAQTLRRDGSNPAAKAGGEHLNVEFGWKPLISDTVSTLLALDQAQRRMEQLARDSGRQVRRRYTFEPEAGAQSRSRPGNIQNLPGQSAFTHLFPNSSLSGTIHETRSYRRDNYFSGAYTFHFDYKHMSKLEKFQRKYMNSLGLELSPSVVWNLMPWSWLSDWVLNLGTVIENAEAFSRDGLVLRYGYLMTKTVSEHTITHSGLTTKNGQSTGPISMTYRRTTKVRNRATPYGFGVATTSFTDRQWSILAALGMTKSDRQLRHGD